MSTSIFKVEYKCDCGIDYGDCDRVCAVILKSNNSCDIYTLYHTDSHQYLGNKEPKTTQGALDCFGDEYLKALSGAIAMKDDNRKTLTEQEHKAIFEK